MKIEAANRIQAAATEDLEFTAIEAMRKQFGGPESVKFIKSDDKDYEFDIKGSFETFHVRGFATVNKKGKLVDGEILFSDKKQGASAKWSQANVVLALHDLKGDKKELTTELEALELRTKMVRAALDLANKL